MVEPVVASSPTGFSTHKFGPERLSRFVRVTPTSNTPLKPTRDTNADCIFGGYRFGLHTLQANSRPLRKQILSFLTFITSFILDTSNMEIPSLLFQSLSAFLWSPRHWTSALSWSSKHKNLFWKTQKLPHRWGDIVSRSVSAGRGSGPRQIWAHLQLLPFPSVHTATLFQEFINKALYGILSFQEVF